MTEAAPFVIGELGTNLRELHTFLWELPVGIAQQIVHAKLYGGGLTWTLEPGESGAAIIERAKQIMASAAPATPWQD